MKGKWWTLLGWLVPIVMLSWPVCAIRLAKPGSFWARRWYEDDEMMKAEQRFSNGPNDSEPPPLPHPQDSEPWPEEDSVLQDRLTRRGTRQQ
jgi:hypothetical protein